MPAAETQELLNLPDSLHRLLQSEELLGKAFYPVFMEKFPEIQAHFEGINMHRLSVILPMALSVIYQHHTHRYPSTRKYLEYVGSHHDLRGIARDSYPKFREALLHTLAQLLGEDWHPALANQWTEAIDDSIETMLSAYGTRVTI